MRAKDFLSYKILRGEDKIGANLIEIYYNETRLLVEFGSALDAENDDITELEQSIINDKGYTAALISHYHGDHAGKISELNIPVFMGELCKKIMQVSSEYTKTKTAKEIVTFTSGKPFNIGEIKITPFLCDHSAIDSYMFLFEANNRSILYTGDYRSTGRKSFDKLLKQLPTSVDVLITEGTNIGNNEKSFITEEELEKQAVEIMNSTDKPIFVLQATTNIDSLVSFFKASKKSKRVFHMDNYQAEVCKTIGGSIPRPDVFSDVFTYTPRKFNDEEKYRRFESYTNKRRRDVIATTKDYTMLTRCSHLPFLQKMNEVQSLDGSVLIYSMWEGYKEEDYTKDFLEEVEKLGIKIVDLHTSGHADVKTIEKLIKHVNPKETITVHTEHKEINEGAESA